MKLKGFQVQQGLPRRCFRKACYKAFRVECPEIKARPWQNLSLLVEQIYRASTMLFLANQLAKGELLPGKDWALPLWVDASILSNNIGEALLSAALKLSPDTPLPLASIKKLIKSGRFWLFVDALDEALALRNSDELKHLIQSYTSLLKPHGRLILSARQEMFVSINQELDLFHTQPQISAVDNTLILRMDRMPFEAVKVAIRGRLSPIESAQIISRIENDAALSELVTRPIFMQIAATAGTKATVAEVLGTGVAALFEAYVKQWSYREADFPRQTRMPTEDRLTACELLALSHMVFGDQQHGFSVDELRNFALSDLSIGIDIKNIDLFVYEARIAMFLERRGDDRFEFAHQSIREFFLARRAARELKAAAALKSAIAPYHCKTLGRVPFLRRMPLARKFTIELCAGNREEARNTIVGILNAAKRWDGHTEFGSLRNEDYIESPPFGLGRYRYLIPNLAGLIQMLPERGKTLSIVDLDGSDLSLTDLTSYFRPEDPSRILLRRANLFATSVTKTQEFASINFISDGALQSDSVAAEYCANNGLLEPSRFNDSITREFVLIPGGEYKVIASDGEYKCVRVCPYLIQRYPVTNRQFKKFLDVHKEWNPIEERRRTQNDYYLGYWPLNAESEVLSDDQWLDRPVVQISWQAAAAFAAANGLRLPTETEWEIAARLGEISSECPRPWGDSLMYKGQPTAISPSPAELKDPAEGKRVPVVNILKEENNVPGFVEWKNTLGIDVPSYMIGLVREWVLDIWSDIYPVKHPLSDYDAPVCLVAQKKRLASSNLIPTGEIMAHRVLRGGGFNSPEEQLTVSFRAPHRSLNVNPDVGFRCVRPIRINTTIF